MWTGCIDSLEPDELARLYQFMPTISLKPLEPTSFKKAKAEFDKGLAVLIREFQERRPDETIVVGVRQLEIQRRCSECKVFHKLKDTHCLWSPPESSTSEAVTIVVPYDIKPSAVTPERRKASAKIAASIWQSVAAALNTWRTEREADSHIGDKRFRLSFPRIDIEVDWQHLEAGAASQAEEDTASG